MEKFGKSQPVKRVEDMRFLTGQGRYVDDIAPEGALHTFVFRSSIAHGVISELDVSDAAEAEGVHLVFTCADMEAAGVDIALNGATVKNRDGSSGAAPLRPMLAKDKVRYVGEPVAVVIADTYGQARDAAEMIMFDVDELPASMGIERGGEALHAEAADNCAFDWGMGDEAATEAAFNAAAKTVALEVGDTVSSSIHWSRVGALPNGTARGCIWPTTGRAFGCIRITWSSPLGWRRKTCG